MASEDTFVLDRFSPILFFSQWQWLWGLGFWFHPWSYQITATCLKGDEDHSKASPGERIENIFKSAQLPQPFPVMVIWFYAQLDSDFPRLGLELCGIMKPWPLAERSWACACASPRGKQPIKMVWAWTYILYPLCNQHHWPGPTKALPLPEPTCYIHLYTTIPNTACMYFSDPPPR